MLTQEELREQGYQVAQMLESRHIELLCAQAVLELAIANLSLDDNKEADALYGAENLFESVIKKMKENVEKSYDLWHALRDSNK